MGHTTEEINIGDPSEVLMNIRVPRELKLKFAEHSKGKKSNVSKRLKELMMADMAGELTVDVGNQSGGKVLVFDCVLTLRQP